MMFFDFQIPVGECPAIGPGRPLLRYHGGKWRMAPAIVELFPEHRIYVEPFGGGGSVLLRKRRSYAEVYNDLDGEIVNLFEVARDQGEELLRAVWLTPYARGEFDKSFLGGGTPLEQARRTLVRSFFGFGGNLTRPNRDQSPQRTGFRDYAKENRRSIPAGDWRNFPDGLAQIVDRLRGVIIENRPAISVMKKHDARDAVHYVDPPYVHSTRSFDCGGSHRGYRFEMTDAEHVELADTLHDLAGAVILSGYRSALYDRLYKRWRKIERQACADGARPRIEVIWINRK